MGNKECDDLKGCVYQAIKDWLYGHSEEIDLPTLSSCMVNIGITIMLFPFSNGYDMTADAQAALRADFDNACDKLRNEASKPSAPPGNLLNLLLGDAYEQLMKAAAATPYAPDEGVPGDIDIQDFIETVNQMRKAQEGAEEKS